MKKTASTTATNAASMSSAIAPEPQMAFDGAVAVALKLPPRRCHFWNIFATFFST